MIDLALEAYRASMAKSLPLRTGKHTRIEPRPENWQPSECHKRAMQAAITPLEAEIMRLREVLTWYAESSMAGLSIDGGERAIAALQEIEG